MNLNYNSVKSDLFSLFTLKKLDSDYGCKSFVFKFKTLIFLFSFSLLSFNSFSSEDPIKSSNSPVTTCANAIVLNASSLPIVSQSLICGTANDLSATTVPVACGGASNSFKGGLESLYTLTPTVSGNYNISIAGVTWTSIFVYAGCPTAGGTCVNSVGSSLSSKTLTVSLNAGTQYYIWFDTFPTPASPCPGTFSISLPVPPPTCPASLGVNSVTIGSLPYATTAQTTCGSGNNITSTNVVSVCGSASYYGAEDRTYIFTPTISGTYTTLLTTTVDSDAGMVLYQGCPFTAGSTCIANSQSTAGLSRTFSPFLTAGVTYYLVIDNFPAPACIASYNLNIDLPPTCGVPTGLVVSDVTFTTADIAWVATVTGTPASYDWEIRTTGAGGSGATGLITFGNTSAPTVTVNDVPGLAGGTSYNLYVRTNCSGGAGSSTWAGPSNFTTATPGESCTTANTIAVAANVGASVNTLLTTGLTADGPAGTCSDATGNPNKKDRWVKFVAPLSGNKIVISTSSGTLTDMVMQVWSSCPATGSSLGCSDDVSTLVFMPELSFCANQYTPGATYYVQIWPYSATQTGNYNIKIYEDTACPVPPTNDECAAIETLTVQTAGNCPANAVTGTTVNATATAGVEKTNCDLFGTYLDVFYKFNSGANTSLNLAFASLTGTCEYGIYSACGTGYLSVCSSSSLTTTITGLTANTDYFIVVWSNTIATQGTFSLCLSELAPPNCVASPTSPSNGGTTCATTNLSWPAVATATAYDVFVDNVLVSDNQTATSYSLTTTAGAHTWRVVPSNTAGEATGCTDFTFTATASPVGDVFANPILLGAITASTSVNGNTLSANCWNDNFNTTSTPGDALFGRASNDAFYKFDITECGSLLNIGVCTSSFDTYIHVLNSSGVSVARDDDSCDTPNSTGSLISALSLPLGTYYVVVEGFGTNSGSYTLDLTYTAGTAPVVFYADADGDGFGNPSVTSTPACSAPVGFVSNNTDCNDASASVNPLASEICYDGIDNNCNGTIDEGCAPIVTVIQPSQCGITLATIDQVVVANAVSNVQGYRFRVTNLSTNLVQTIDRFLRVFKLTDLPVYAFNTTYQVEVSVRFNNVWQPFFGTPCTVTTPATTTVIQASQCGSTLTSLSQVIYANSVPFATGYRFKITNQATSQSQTIDRVLREFRMNLLSSTVLTGGTAFTVEVAVKNTDGTYLPYGTACTITTTSSPSILVRENTAVAKQLPLSIIAYPNPFAADFKLNVTTSSDATLQVIVYDMLGKVVENRQVKSTEIENLEVGSNYPAGVYNVIVTQGESVETVRVIKR